jgi:hypothetical protein
MTLIFPFLFLPFYGVLVLSLKGHSGLHRIAQRHCGSFLRGIEQESLHFGVGDGAKMEQVFLGSASPSNLFEPDWQPASLLCHQWGIGWEPWGKRRQRVPLALELFNLWERHVKMTMMQVKYKKGCNRDRSRKMGGSDWSSQSINMGVPSWRLHLAVFWLEELDLCSRWVHVQARISCFLLCVIGQAA